MVGRLSSADRTRVGEIRELLAAIDLRTPNSDEWAEPFAQTLGLDQYMLYSFQPRDDSLELSRFDTLGWPSSASTRAKSFLEGVRPNFAYFNPLRPATWQRNRAFAEAQLIERTGMTPPSALRLAREILTPQTDQLRTLICDGPALVAWVGGFRDGRFASRDVQILQALVPSLRARLLVEGTLNLKCNYRELFGAALESIGAPAYVINQGGSLVHANAVGLALFADSRVDIQNRLRRILQATKKGECAPGLSVSQVDGYWLIVDRTLASGRHEARVACWCRDMRLTPRQGQVAVLVAEGHTNSSIGAILGCSERTVEVHVSSILARASASSRAELVARLALYDS